MGSVCSLTVYFFYMPRFFYVSKSVQFQLDLSGRPLTLPRVTTFSFSQAQVMPREQYTDVSIRGRNSYLWREGTMVCKRFLQMKSGTRPSVYKVSSGDKRGTLGSRLGSLLVYLHGQRTCGEAVSYVSQVIILSLVPTPAFIAFNSSHSVTKTMATNLSMNIQVRQSTCLFL